MTVVQSLSRVRLCDPMDCSLSGSSVLGILQARIPEWVAVPSSRGPSHPRPPAPEWGACPPPGDLLTPGALLQGTFSSRPPAL